LPAIRNRATLLSAAAAILAVGAVALFLGRRPHPFLRAEETATAPPTAAPTSLTVGARLTVIALGVSGGVSMIYEVAWTRALALVIGSSTYAFTAMLVAVLIGIAGGSALYSWLWGTRRASPATFAVLQTGIGVTTTCVVVFFPRMPEVFLAGLAWS